MYGYTEIVKILIKHSNNPNAPNNKIKGKTPIYWAAKNGHTGIVKALIRCTDNPNAPNDDEVTPINMAVEHGHTEIVKILILLSTLTTLMPLMIMDIPLFIWLQDMVTLKLSRL